MPLFVVANLENKALCQVVSGHKLLRNKINLKQLASAVGNIAFSSQMKSYWTLMSMTTLVDTRWNYSYIFSLETYKIIAQNRLQLMPRLLLMMRESSWPTIN